MGEVCMLAMDLDFASSWRVDDRVEYLILLE